MRASIIEATEERHFGSSQPCTIQEILSQRLQHIYRLEQWKRNLPSASALATYAEMVTWSPPSYSNNRFRTLLTIHYHVTILLINRPVLDSITEHELGQDAFHPCTGEISIAVENDFAAAKEFDNIVSCIAKTCPEYLDNNAVWWTCNYYGEFFPLRYRLRNTRLTSDSLHGRFAFVRNTSCELPRQLHRAKQIA